jgi:DNA-binding beta-propeller fold protein YncE
VAAGVDVHRLDGQIQLPDDRMQEPLVRPGLREPHVTALPAVGPGDREWQRLGRTLGGRGTVTRIDARSGRVRGRPITVGTSEPSIGIAVGDGAVWVARPAGDSVTRILP